MLARFPFFFRHDAVTKIRTQVQVDVCSFVLLSARRQLHALLHS